MDKRTKAYKIESLSPFAGSNPGLINWIPRNVQAALSASQTIDLLYAIQRAQKESVRQAASRSPRLNPGGPKVRMFTQEEAENALQ